MCMTLSWNMHWDWPYVSLSCWTQRPESTMTRQRPWCWLRAGCRTHSIGGGIANERLMCCRRCGHSWHWRCVIGGGLQRGRVTRTPHRGTVGIKVAWGGAANGEEGYKHHRGHRQRNLVSLHSCCIATNDDDQSKKMFLMYDYMHKGSLDKDIFEVGEGQGRQQATFSWEQRRIVAALSFAVRPACSGTLVTPWVCSCPPGCRLPTHSHHSCFVCCWSSN